MNKITFLLLFSISVFSQETEFKFAKDGFTDFVVTSFENKTQSEIYKKALQWIEVTYKNPKEVLKAQIENDYLRFEAIEKNLFCLKPTMCSDMKYQIEVSFKDGKYKFDLLALDQDIPNVGWVHFGGLEDGKFYFNENGEVKSKFKIIAEEIPKYFNSLNKSLNDFIASNEIPSKKTDW